MPISPDPQFPERGTRLYERKLADNQERRGPMRFQENIVSDRDVPAGFVAGVEQGHTTAPGRMNNNAKVDTKYPEETLAERAHVGSASWVQAPSFLGEFAHGSFQDYGALQYERAFRPDVKQWRVNPASVFD